MGEWSLRAHNACSAILLHPEIIVNVLLLIRLVTAGAAGLFATLLGLLLLGLLPEGEIDCAILLNI